MTVFLTILRIIGIVLLSILGLILLLLLILLFAPIHYRADITFDNSLESVTAHVKVNWLLYIVRFRLEFLKKKLSYFLKILWITILPRQKTGKARKAAHKKAGRKHSAASKENEPYVPPEQEKIEEHVLEDAVPDDHFSSSKEGHKDAGRKDTVNAENKKHSGNLFSGIKSKIDKIKHDISKIRYKINDICDKIKSGNLKLSYYRQILEDEDTHTAVSELLNRIARLCRHIFPRRLKGKIHFGTGDPADTGEILGAASMFYPIYGSNITLIPDFENKCIDGSLTAKGYIQLYFVIYAAVRVYFDKKIRKLYQEIKEK